MSPSESTRMNRLRPLTFFPIVPAVARGPCGLHRRVVDALRLGFRRVPGPDPHVRPEPRVHVLPETGLAPRGEVVEHGLEVREIVRQQFPRGPTTQVVEDSAHQRPTVHRPATALLRARLGFGNQRFEPLPPRICQVGWVWLPCRAHTGNLQGGYRSRPFSDALLACVLKPADWGEAFGACSGSWRFGLSELRHPPPSLSTSCISTSDWSSLPRRNVSVPTGTKPHRS